MPKQQRSGPNRIDSGCVRKKKLVTIDEIGEKPPTLARGLWTVYTWASGIAAVNRSGLNSGQTRGDGRLRQLVVGTGSVQGPVSGDGLDQAVKHHATAPTNVLLYPR